MFGKQRKPVTSPDAETELQPTAGKERRPLLVRLFSIKFWGAVKLILLCVLVGLIQRAGVIQTRPEDVFDPWSMIQAIWENTFRGLIWALQNGWQPALLGATIVLPIWVLWRLVSLPFRR